MYVLTLDENPFKSAQYHCDADVSKAIVMLHQLFSNVHRMYPAPLTKVIEKQLLPLRFEKGIFTGWLGESVNNYNWICMMFQALCKEKINMTGECKQLDLAEKLFKFQPKIEDFGKKTFNWGNVYAIPTSHIPIEYRHAASASHTKSFAIGNCRNYYIMDTSVERTWNNRSIPQWYVEKEVVTW